MAVNGNTIFCDDIRQEVAGKISVMGIYGAELNVFSSFPTVLPKLCLVVMARFPLEQTITNPKLQIYLPEDDETPSILLELPDWPVTKEQTEQKSELPFPDALQLNSRFSFHTLSPFFIRQEGWLRVRVLTDEGRLKVGALKIKSTPNPESGKT